MQQVLKIAESEDDDTFFAYHGMSQNYRLYQDIVQAVFEEVLEIPLPRDFYFLRIPGEEIWKWENGKTSFLDHYNNRPIPKEWKDLVIANFLAIINKGLNTTLELSQFSEPDYEILWGFFDDHLEFLFWQDWINKTEKYAIPQDYTWETPVANKNLPIVIQVISRHLEQQKMDISPQNIEQWFGVNFKDYFDTWKVFMLREIPSVDKELVYKIYNLDTKFDDTSYPQNSQLISLNLSAFGNFEDIGSFSAGIFFENKSILNGDDPLERILQDFFAHIGLDSSLASLLWNEGQQILAEYGNNRGCLLQLFDNSSHAGLTPFALANHDLYVSFRHGIPLFDITPADYIQGHLVLTDGYKDMEMRLVANNKTNLNPFSNLRMIRHDGLTVLDPELIPSKMKALLKQHAHKDQAKIQTYLETLEQVWEVSLQKTLKS